MKPSTPMLLSFLLPLAVAANAHAQEPSGATPQDISMAAVAKAPDADLPAPESPLLERRSEGLRTAGIVMIPLASVAIVGGMLVTVAGAMGAGHVLKPRRAAAGPSRPERSPVEWIAVSSRSP